MLESAQEKSLSGKGSLSSHLRLMLGLLLVLFNLWYIARKGIAEQNQEQIERLSAQVQALSDRISIQSDKVDQQLIKRDAVRSRAELFLEQLKEIQRSQE